jgi:hypothetical protein
MLLYRTNRLFLVGMMAYAPLHRQADPRPEQLGEPGLRTPGTLRMSRAGEAVRRLAGVALYPVVVRFRSSLAIGINHPAHEQNASGWIVPNHE